MAFKVNNLDISSRWIIALMTKCSVYGFFRRYLGANKPIPREHDVVSYALQRRALSDAGGLVIRKSSFFSGRQIRRNRHGIPRRTLGSTLTSNVLSESVWRATSFTTRSQARLAKLMLEPPH